MTQQDLPKLDAVPREITARHDGVCRRCSCVVKRGARVWWYPHNGAVVHVACMKKSEEELRGGVGDTAKR